ncbi:MAG: hypothetical protein V1861_01250 [Candidatus Micrarchaeota archaeon]
MNPGRRAKSSDGRQKVVSLLKAKRLPYSQRPAIEPLCEVLAMTANISEDDRLVIAEADIRADIGVGDLSQTALRKCRYILIHASEGFTDAALCELAVARTVRIIRDYGEPEGIPLLSLANSLHGGSRVVREAVSDGLARIGNEESLEIMLKLLASDLDSPKAHLRSISEFADRFPKLAGRIIEEMRRFEIACPAIPDAISEIESMARSKD